MELKTYYTIWIVGVALRFCRPELELHASGYGGLFIARQGSNRDGYNNRRSGSSDSPVS
jgi:hypothetical protein